MRDLLGPLVVDEILIRLLRTPIGTRVAQIGEPKSGVHRIAEAVSWIRAHFAQPVTVEEMAASVHMSASSFHQRFKAVTTMSPLQYQKVLRLHEARRLMLFQSMDASDACHRVGYLSPSQFSREYARFFGSAPTKDIARLRAGGIRRPRRCGKNQLTLVSCIAPSARQITPSLVSDRRTLRDVSRGDTGRTVNKAGPDSPLLLGLEGLVWIDASGPSRRHIRRARSRARQRAHHARQCRRIGWRDAEQQRRDPPAGRKGAGQSSAQANHSQRGAFAHEQPDDVGWRGADCQPKTDFSPR